MTAVLRVQDVVAGYGEVEILHGVSITVSEAEIVAIIGPNGAGKSTLLKAIFGLVSVQNGSVHLAERDVTNMAPNKIVQSGMSYVPQTENVFPSLTINENLEMGAYVRRDGLRDRLERVYGLFPDIASRRSERAGRLSGGQRQMLALARALMLDPKVLLLDEPSASLSPKMVDSIFEKIGDINRGGTAILLVEQNAKEALSFASRAYVLAMGQNRFEGEAKSMLESEEVGKLYLGA
ncbi:MAG: ABC transporter ATP-binding protein [Chloroflexi bacterium]|nr:ABC transporter ATP-binding protein [Chloroflexota bacterium]MCH8920193.1 ABC transporter ATP-binding protein [Chloroflexota bacterium]